MKKKQFKVPKTLGACADRLHKLREEMGEYNKKLGDLKDEFNAIKEHVIDTLPKSDAQGVLGHVARVAIVKKEVPTIKAENWDKFYEYVRENNAFELLQRRVSAPACKERWEDGVLIPGVEKYTVVDVSLTKIPSK